MYQYLFGSVQEFYRSVTAKNPMPGNFLKLVTGQCDRFLRFAADGHPNNHTWMPTGEGEENQILFCRTGEKKQAHAPSYFLHARTLTVTPGDLLENFEGLLQTAFYSEAQFDALASGGEVAGPESHWTREDAPLAMDLEVLRAVLYGLVSRWCFASKPVVIAVPAGEDYDRFTYRAIRTIYSCLPAVMRGEIGFMTYAKPDEKLDSVGLFFVPEDVATESAIYLDGRKGAIAPHLENYLDPSWKELLDLLAECSRRQSLLEGFLRDVELRRGMGNLRANDYLNYYLQLGLLNADVENPKVFGQWLTIASDEKSCPEGLRAELLSRLPGIVTEEVFRKHTGESWKTIASCGDIMKLLSQYEPLFRCHPALESVAQRAIDTYFNNLLSQADTLARAEQVLEEVKTLQQSTAGRYPDAALPDLCISAQLTISKNLLTKAFEDMNEEARKQTEPFLLWNSLISMQEAATAAVTGNWSEDVKTANETALASLAKHASELVTQALAADVKPKEPADGKKNSAYYQAELERLQKLRDRISGYTMFPQTQVVAELNKTIETLNGDFTASGVLKEEAIRNIFGSAGYFSSLNQLAGVSVLTDEEKQAQLSKELRKNRPGDLNAYLEGYYNTFKEKLSFGSLAGRGEFVAGAVVQDLTELLRLPMRLELRELKLMGLMTLLEDRKLYNQLFGGHRPCENVTLSYANKEYTLTIPRLQAALGQLIEHPDAPAGNKDVKEVEGLLRTAGLLPEPKKPATAPTPAASPDFFDMPTGDTWGERRPKRDKKGGKEKKPEPAEQEEKVPSFAKKKMSPLTIILMVLVGVLAALSITLGIILASGGSSAPAETTVTTTEAVTEQTPEKPVTPPAV